MRGSRGTRGIDVSLLLTRAPTFRSSAVAASFSVSPDKTAASLTTNGTDTITLTITRNGGHATTVNISDSGLPTGVTASYPDGSSWTGSNTGTRRVVLTGSSAPDVSSDAFTITSTDGVAPDVESCTCTVTTAGAFAANRPSGLTTDLDTLFPASEVPENSGGSTGYTWGDYGASGTNGENLTGQSTPYGTTALRTNYLTGVTYNGTGGIGIFGPTGINKRKLYICLAFRASANYCLHPGAEKFLYMYTRSVSDASQKPLLVEWNMNVPSAISGETRTGGIWGLEFIPNLDRTDLEYPLEGGGTYWWIYQTSTSSRVHRDTDHVIEMSFEMNTPGASDGKVRVWLDGDLCISRDDIYFNGGSGNQGTFDQVKWDGTRGGGPDSAAIPSPGTYRDYQRLLVATAA